MEAALELEDDVFFADLSKQISLLIMDDDDESLITKYPSENLQPLTRAIHTPSTQASFLNYDHRKRESKGTGVFIPLSSQPIRKNNTKQARFAPATGNKFHNQRPNSELYHHNSRGLPQMACYNNNFSSSYYDSSNLGRF